MIRFLSLLAAASLLLVLPCHAGDWAAPIGEAPLGASAAGAQGVLGPPQLKFGRRAAGSEFPGPPFLTASYRHTFEADFDEPKFGELSVDDLSLIAPVLPLNFGDFHILTLLNYRATEFDTSVPVTNGIPEDTLHSFRIPVIFLHDISEQWLWGGMIMPGWSGDLDGSSSDAFSISAAVGAGYAFGPHLRVFGGAFYSNGFDDDTLIPGVAFIWRPSDKLEVSLLGPIGGITYALNDKTTIALAARYDSKTWNVDADSLGPVRDVKVTEFRLGLRLERQLADRFWGYVMGGYSFARELEVEDLSSNSLLEDDIDSAPFVQIGLNGRF